MKKKKIVASLGKNIKDLKTIINFANLGVDVFQLNLSYITLEECHSYIEKIKEASKKTKKVLGIMLDLDGPSIRLDRLKEEKVFLQLKKEIRFYNYSVVCGDTQLSTNYNNLAELVNLDDIITIGYGDVKLKVIDINRDNFLCSVVDEGYIKSNQTIHIEKDNLKLPFISPKDKKNILFAIENNVDFLALSYVRDEQDVLSVVDMLIENGNDHIGILSKIETEESFENLEEILKVSDGVIVARGDLGSNIEVEKLPFYQKEILKMTSNYQKIGLVSTDLLKSMVTEKSPSRGEIVDIYNAVLDKADGLILSEETSVGENPCEVIAITSKILEEAEEHFDYKENLEETFKEGKLDVTSTISYSVVNSALLLNASCILANTISGYTAKKISYFRPRCSILGLSPNKETVSSLTLNYGIIPVLVKKYNNTDEILKECINKYKEIIDYKNNDIVIITGGLPIDSKNTDFMKIEKINEQE